MHSDSEKWGELQVLFHLAEEAPGSERNRVLEESCADAGLRRRVLELLRASEPGSAPVAPGTQQSIGPYKLDRLLGSGGMGSVYLAERPVGGSTQQVALKILAPHAAGPSFIDRFAREQRILGSLNHSGITRMLDAGLGENGQPYLAMDYVDGAPIDAYCDEHELSVEARLRLFQQICEAVDYAHRNLVVHLDLKPSNILTSPGGEVKLLDFGTSKLMAADGQYTATLMATPSYASPEQLRGDRPSTACDIYSLGVVLFELLTGRRPSGESSAAVLIERAITEREPEHPDAAVTGPAARTRGVTENRLRAILAGDLSTIVTKCLRPRPQDRYLSVSALTDDVARYLDGRPVLAQKQTTVYQLKKFVRRNRGRVAASLVMAIALTASLGYAWWGQRRAVQEGQRAVRMQNFMTRLFSMANSNYTGKPAATVKEFLQLAVKVLPQFIREPGDLRRAQLSLANSLSLNDDFTTAKQVYAEALRTARAARDAPAEAEALGSLGQIAFFEGQNQMALEDTAKALELSRLRGTPAELRLQIAQSYVLVHEDLGQTSESNIKLLQAAVDEAKATNLPANEVSGALSQLGDLVMNRGRLEEARRNFQEGLALLKNDPLSTCDQAATLYGLGGVFRTENNPAAAAPVLRDAYERMKRCRGEGRDTLSTLGYWADAMVSTGHAAEAMPEIERAAPMWRKPPIDKAALYQELWTQGHAYLAVGRFPDAAKVGVEIVPLATSVFAPADRRVGRAHLLMGQALAGLGKDKDAMPEAEAAYANLSSGPVSPLAKSYAAEAQALVNKLRAK